MKQNDLLTEFNAQNLGKQREDICALNANAQILFSAARLLARDAAVAREAGEKRHSQHLSGLSEELWIEAHAYDDWAWELLKQSAARPKLPLVSIDVPSPLTISKKR